MTSDSKCLFEAYAKSIAVYYAAEKAFVADPTAKTLHSYHVAADRFRFQALRAELTQDKSVGR